MRVKTTERGWIGHLIVGHLCNFRRNTLVEVGSKKAVVSTVGQYVPDIRKSSEAEQVGYCRWYETAAFMAEHDGQYWDANVEDEIFSDALPAKDDRETFAQATRRYPEGIDNAANDMHEKAIREVANILTVLEEQG